MPNFRIHRMKDAPRQNFRWAPHVSGAAQVKQKDYEPEVRGIEAAHEYAAWSMLRESEQPLTVGDLLETESGDLRVCKYVGFEKATWLVPEIPSGQQFAGPPVTDPQPMNQPVNA
jgi:hypothetical protein